MLNPKDAPEPVCAVEDSTEYARHLRRHTARIHTKIPED